MGDSAPGQHDHARSDPGRFDLIETMRFTPEAGIPLLELHLERLRESTQALAFEYDRHALRNAIQALCFDAERPSKLRLVAARSGAFSLELTDLPAELSQPVVCGVLQLPVDSGDWRLRHKTTERGFYERGLAVAQTAGAHEALFLRDDGLLTEGCFTNLFVERDGVLLTPPATLGLLPGVLRCSLLADGRARETELTLDDLAGGFLVGNALRGLMPATLLT
jgi:para-aminobenzoate synthetase/4-amino-4-deoxychorismate lyase